ncbi:MAG: Vitamin B12 transporter BtuB [Steroidobacteraceae bacterium]|nr:Vitamin B12 transporter BtuB [Steroidobacteraceae bacterium]
MTRFRARAGVLSQVAALTTGIALSSTAAFAQQAEGQVPPEDSSMDIIQEVTVTAQRREESLQETPIAITAFSYRDLETQRVNNVMDLLNKVPSVNLAPFAGTRVAPNLFIRGMGNLNAQTTKDMATGIYIDGVPVGRGIGLAADIADLERVEVLRGPQGTLWGRNTTAGAINFITQKPNDELSFAGQLTAGSWDQVSGRLRANVPITDRLFARVAYMRLENDGWVENTNTTLPNQINFNEDRVKEAYKAAVRFEPADNIVADYSFDSSRMVYGNHFYQIIAGPLAVPGRQESANRTRGLNPSRTEVSGHNLTVSWELGDVTLKSISAYRDLDSATNMNFVDIFTQDNNQAQHQFSEELQLIGDAFGRLKYVVGLFYFEEASHEALSSSFAGGALVDFWRVKAEGTSAAIYGQATWTPPVLDDRFDITLGMRYTEDSRKAVKTYVNPGFTPALTGLVVAGDRDFSSFNPAVTLDYAFTDSIRSYAKYSTGYRAGGFNTQSTPAFFGPGFNEENVKAWEVGLKSDLLNKRLRVNLAAFRNKYSDLQVDQARTPPIFTDTLNAGSATVKGVELESVAVLAHGLTANLFYSWLDGEYQSYIDNGVELAAVRHMQNAPRYQVGAGVEYAFPHLAIGDLVLNIDYRKQADFYAGPIANTHSPGYDVWNARLQLAEIPAPHGTFRVAVWGRNLGDEVYRLSTTNLGVISAQFGPPRSVGVDAIYEF